MMILREFLGGKEYIDLSSEQGWHDWVVCIVQDEEQAQHLAEQIEAQGSVIVNESEPEYIERYTKI